ncbi:sensor histidine kinase [Aeromicrobium sp. Leaf245]|uniref:sensor histidine kinase n=1 Tax=Aeromicrobium sp. Leaf245 TaxID=1736306 RepID=UPI000A96C573|nr:sensor histidine kinase [Aeromicrobium sp. Leaf245]
MGRLDRSWTRPRPTRAQVRTDVLVGLVAAVVSVASVEVFASASGASTGWKGVEAYVWFGICGLALCGRRRFPITVLLVVSAVFIVIGERLLELGVVFTVQMTLFAALYAAWAWSRLPRALWAVTGLVLVGMFGWLVWSLNNGTMGPLGEQTGLLPPKVALVVYSLAINVAYFFGAIAWGQSAYLSARRSALVEDQRERERAVQGLEQQQAVQAERVRIARDLHDVVAHHVSGIGVQAAGAGRLLEARPERAREALTAIETSSRQAVSQMHQIVGLLRSAEEAGPADRGPQPGIADIEALAVTTERPAVVVDVVGAPFPVPDTVGLSLYRVAQEALSNVRRHSGAPSARITLRYLTDSGERPAVEVEVLDDGPTRTAPDEASGGFGLDGIRERAAMHGGIADIGPRPTGGYRVRVRIPVDQEDA